MSDVVSLATGKGPSTESMLEILESMRRGVEQGRIVAFGAVAITPSDGTMFFSASDGLVTRLRMMGAVNALATKWNVEGAAGPTTG